MTQLIKKMECIFNKLNIKNSYDIAVELIDGYNYQFYYDMFDDSKTFSHSGGGNNTDSVKFEYNGVDFLFDKYDEHNNVDYSIYQKNDINRHCVLIMINKKEKFACIHAISYDASCFNKHQLDTFEDNANGSLLLKVTLAFINKIKPHYDLQYIQLSDNSKKRCDIIKEDIDLDSFLMLVSGDTWYGKYGFVPFDKDKKMTHIYNLKKYKDNQKIVNDTKIKDTKIVGTIEYVMKKIDMDDRIINNIKKKAQKYPNISVKKFLNWFMRKEIDSQIYHVFYLAYRQIMYDLKMHDLHNMCYWKII